MKKLIYLLSLCVFITTNAYADCEQGCRIELKCIDSQNNNQELDVNKCIGEYTTYRLRTDEGFFSDYLSKIAKDNEYSIIVPEYFKFWLEIPDRNLTLTLNAYDVNTNKLVSTVSKQYGFITIKNMRDNGKWKTCVLGMAGEGPDICDMEK